jgi:pimeloyl-ACP methyl ester carboxylesterase
MGGNAVVRMGVNTLNLDEQPIFLVPGIMGSRLHLAGNAQLPIWDPDDTAAMLRLADMFTSYRASWMAMSNRAEVFVAAKSPKSLMGSQQARGWGGVAWGFYGAGLEQLETKSASINGAVYAFGYDWRQTNWLSGQLLARAIAMIRKKHNGRKVLVVTHSMGGLVTRAACKQGAESDILGVVHTMQPANGTPLAYRQAKTGGKALKWVLADVVLGRIVGRSPTQNAAISAGLRAPFELLPNDSHARPTGNELTDEPGAPNRKAWLTMDANLKVGLKPGYSVYDVYKERSGKVGLIDYNMYAATESVDIDEGYLFEDHVSGPAISSGFTSAVDAAHNFHATRLQGYVHPNTSVVAGTGLETDVSLHLDRDTHWFSDDSTSPVMGRENLGDGTVSQSSSTSLPLKGNPGLSIAAKDRQKFVSGVAHAAAFGTSQKFNDVVWEMCEQVLQCAESRE